MDNDGSSVHSFERKLIESGFCTGNHDFVEAWITIPKLEVKNEVQGEAIKLKKMDSLI